MHLNVVFLIFVVARRRADIKRKKLKTLGKSKSTESEEECEEEEADEGKTRLISNDTYYGIESGSRKNPVFLYL